MKRIFSSVFGAHLYGTDTPNSDRDYKVLYLRCPEDRLDQKYRDHYVIKTADNTARNSSDDIDVEMFEVNRFMKLLYDGHILCLDMMFTKSNMMMHKPDPLWDLIFANREKFISKSVEYYFTYVIDQAKKYGIKGSRLGTLKTVMPLFEQKIQSGMSKIRLCDDPEFLQQVASFPLIELVIFDQNNLRMGKNYLDVLGKKITLSSRYENAYAVLENFLHLYGQRIHDVVANNGVDWKAMSHAVRSLTQGIELYQTGMIEFPLHNRDLLKDIKAGNYSFKDVEIMLADLSSDLRAAMKSSIFPDQVAQADKDWISGVIQEASYYAIDNTPDDFVQMIRNELIVPKVSSNIGSEQKDNFLNLGEPK